MNYNAHYFTVDLGDSQYRNHSTHLLFLDGPGGPYKLIFNFDKLQRGENLKQSLDRQVKHLTRQTQQFKLLYVRPTEVGITKIEGWELETSFFQSSKHFYQLQCMFMINATEIAIITLGSEVPISDGQRAKWRKYIDNLVPQEV